LKWGRLTSSLGVILIAVGFIVTMVAVCFVYFTTDWQYVATLAFGFYMLAFLFFILAPIVSIYFLRIHEELGSRFFQKATDIKQFSPPEVIVTNLMLNFTFFTLIYLLPFREVLCGFLPPLKAAEAFIPKSFQELIQMSGSLFLFAFYVPTVSLGPAFIYTIRFLRKKEENRGQRLFEFFQVLLYASLLLAGLTWYYGVTPPGGTFYGYRNMLLLIVLPRSLGGVGSLMLLEKIKEKPPYIA